MHHVRIRSLAVIIVASLIMLPLSALPLSTVVEKALAESPRMQDLELTKRDTLLQIGLNQAEDGVGISVSGNLTTTVDFDKSSTSLSSSGVAATISLPNDGNTAIKVSTGEITYKTSDSTYSVSPSVGASHTITFGLTSDNRKSLSNRQAEILATSTYETRRVNYTTTLYTQIDTILGNEKSIKKTSKELADLKRTLEQNLTLKLVREGSLVHRASEQAIQSKETTLEALNAARELYLRQFVDLVGFSWEGVDEIPEPNLLFNPDEKKNSTLTLKSLALDLAKEDLALEKAKYTNTSLKLSGSVGATTSDARNYIDAGASAAFAAYQYSLSGSVAATYNISKNTFTPSLTIGGSWSNNPSSYSEGLKLQQLENAVLTADLAYRTALDEYNQSVVSLQNSIASYLMNYSLLLQTIAYNQETLEQQQDLFARGLATAQQVEDAQFDVDLDVYSLNSSLLEALKLENQIKSLHL